jgi:hypothetical protein
MGKVARNVVLGLTISVSVAAAAAEPAAAKRALHHYADIKDLLALRTPKPTRCCNAY